MPLIPKKLVAALVAALIGAPALAVSLMIAAPGAPERPPVVQMAIVPRAIRVRKQRRYATVRPIRSRRLRRLRASKLWSGPRGLNLRPRLPVRESYARGPPRRG